MSKKAIINRILRIIIIVMILSSFLFISVIVIKGITKTMKDTERKDLNETFVSDVTSE